VTLDGHVDTLLSSIKAIKTSLSAIISTLEELSETSDHSTHRAVGAHCLLLQLKYFEFLLLLVLFERIFTITSKLSDLLQAPKLNYAAAASCISATKRAIQSLREKDEWIKILQEATSMADKHGVTVVAQSRRIRTHSIPSRYSDSVVEEVTGCRSIAVSDYRTHLYYKVIDAIRKEMDRRFSELNISLLNGMQALHPQSEKFLDMNTSAPFMLHYCIDKDDVHAEIATAKSFLNDIVPVPDTLDVK
jgi:hypothetical protein